MADGRGLYENGGRDLSPEGWEEMARQMEEIKERSEDVAKALREHGRGSEKFRYAKERWLSAWRKPMALAILFPSSDLN